MDPETLAEARRAVLAATREVDEWQAIWLQTAAWARQARAVCAARDAAKAVLAERLLTLAELQEDADFEEAATDDP